MPEIGMSGSMSGVGKRSLLATAPNLDSTEGDGQAHFRAFLIVEKANMGTEKRWKEPPNSISRQKPSRVVYQG